MPTAALSRAEQKQRTRRKLLDATIDLIAKEGMAGVTLGKVAAHTGLSRGICNYHFETKEQLMLEAFRMLYQEHEQVWRQLATPSPVPAAVRLKALIEALLSPPIADDTKLAVWMAFWGVTPHRQTYLELCANVDREYELAVKSLIAELAPDQTAVNGMSLQAISVTLTSMIDGFWVNYLISPGCLTPQDAINACLMFLTGFFPELRATFFECAAQ